MAPPFSLTFVERTGGEGWWWWLFFHNVPHGPLRNALWPHFYTKRILIFLIIYVFRFYDNRYMKLKLLLTRAIKLGVNQKPNNSRRLRYSPSTRSQFSPSWSSLITLVPRPTYLPTAINSLHNDGGLSGKSITDKRQMTGCPCYGGGGNCHLESLAAVLNFSM